SAQRHLESAQAYARYQELLREENAVDFADLIYLTYQLLKKHPDIRAKLQEQFRYILVDEFQDTNYLQYEILKLLVNKEKNITVVGDDDQSIFRWRGAALSNILFFQRDFPKAKKVVLVQNYRSPQEILDIAYKTIQHNNPDRLEVKAKVKKRLIGEFSYKRAVNFQYFDHVQSEADFIIQQIKEAQKKKIPLREIAILVRRNHLAQHYIKALASAGIPYVFSGESGIYFRPEISMLISFLKCLVSNNDWLAYYNLAQSELYGVDLADLAEIFDLIRRQNLSVYRTLSNIRQYQNYLQLSEDTLQKIEELTKDLAYFRQLAKEASAGQVLYQFLKKKGLLKRLSRQNSLEDELKLKNIADFFRKVILEFEQATSDHSVAHLYEYLDDLLSVYATPEIEEIDPELEAVRVLTFHSAKGLEFEVVFMPALTADYLPTPHRRESLEIPDEFIHEILPEGDYHEQEERRLFYVGLTRAKRYLFLSYALDYGGKRLKKPSPFLYEALGAKALKKAEQTRLSKLQQIELFSTEARELRLLKPSGPLALSYKVIDDYETCPLKYKFVKILRVPVLQSFAVAFGASIHHTLEEYYKKLLSGEKLSLKELLELFEQKWRAEGYLHRKHEKEAFRQGKKALENFFKSPFAKIKPLATEQPFSVKVGEDLVSGRFDIVLPGEKGVKIFDFKTGLVDRQRAENQVRSSLQLKIYTWAYHKIHGKLPEKVGLFFVNSNLYVELAPTERYFSRIEEKIKRVAEGIRKRQFDPTPSRFACTYCAYRETCPFAYR
ncbi:ATP-dependent helicase, partial [bacterium]|nr:ATP-dependent helicase [bacterium]